jgi:hypothetical protein
VNYPLRLDFESLRRQRRQQTVYHLDLRRLLGCLFRYHLLFHHLRHSWRYWEYLHLDRHRHRPLLHNK